MRASTCAKFARTSSGPSIGMAALFGPPFPAIDGRVCETVRVLVSGAQRVADRKPGELAGEPAGAPVHRNQVRMFDAVRAEHLLHEQLGVRDDLDVIGSFSLRDRERFE